MIRILRSKLFQWLIKPTISLLPQIPPDPQLSAALEKQQEHARSLMAERNRLKRSSLAQKRIHYFRDKPRNGHFL